MASTLSSSSTLTDVQAAYDDNASYAEDDSTAKANAFVTAGLILLRRVAKRGTHGGRGSEEFEMAPELIQGEIDRARAWLASHQSAGGKAKHQSLVTFRT